MAFTTRTLSLADFRRDSIKPQDRTPVNERRSSLAPPRLTQQRRHSLEPPVSPTGSRRSSLEPPSLRTGSRRGSGASDASAAGSEKSYVDQIRYSFSLHVQSLISLVGKTPEAPPPPPPKPKTKWEKFTEFCRNSVPCVKKPEPEPPTTFYSSMTGVFLPIVHRITGAPEPKPSFWRRQGMVCISVPLFIVSP